jgi:DNA-binding MarR family transcriptional regulator
MSGRILIIPSALALDMQFTPGTIRLWLLLQATAKHKDDEGNLVNMRDRREIAQELNTGYMTVSNALLNLQKAGWVRIDRIPDQHGRKITIFETPQTPVSPTKLNAAGGPGESQTPAEI